MTDDTHKSEKPKHEKLQLVEFDENTKRQFDAFDKLREAAWKSFDGRRQHEWKVSLALWTALAALAAGLVMHAEILKNFSLRPLCLFATWILCLHVMWVDRVGRRNDWDRRLSQFFEEQMHALLKTNLPPDIQEHWKIPAKRTGPTYSACFQILVTAGLIAATIALAMRTIP
jgi:hypothetical protein